MKEAEGYDRTDISPPAEQTNSCGPCPKRPPQHRRPLQRFGRRSRILGTARRRPPRGLARRPGRARPSPTCSSETSPPKAGSPNRSRPNSPRSPPNSILGEAGVVEYGERDLRRIPRPRRDERTRRPPLRLWPGYTALRPRDPLHPRAPRRRGNGRRRHPREHPRPRDEPRRARAPRSSSSTWDESPSGIARAPRSSPGFAKPASRPVNRARSTSHHPARPLPLGRRRSRMGR